MGEQAREIPDPAARLPKGGSAVEYWDLTMELDSGHHLFVRFAITNEGPGDQVGFVVEDGEVRLVRRERRIEAAFGICKAKVSVTDDEMEQAIRNRAVK